MGKMAFLFLLFTSGVFAQGKFHISGTLDCEYSGKIYLMFDSTVDSAEVKNQTFQFHGILKRRESEAIISLQNPRIVDSFILEANEIALDMRCAPDDEDAHKWNMVARSVKGSESNDLYNKFNSDLEAYGGGKIDKGAILAAGKSIVETHLESPIGIYVLQSLVYHFTETDREMLRELFSKLKLVHDTNSITANSTIFDKLYPDKTAVVNAPMQHFKLQNEKGKIVNSETLKGKWILLDFWASWCAGCIEEFPRLKQLYGKKNLEIVSVSIDADKQRWLKAVTEANLPWTNLRSDVYADKVASIYRTYKGIPLLYLVNPEGIIVAKNPTLAEINAYVK